MKISKFLMSIAIILLLSSVNVTSIEDANKTGVPTSNITKGLINISKLDVSDESYSYDKVPRSSKAVSIKYTKAEINELENREITNPKIPYSLEFISENFTPSKKLDGRMEGTLQRFNAPDYTGKNYTYGFIMITGRITPEKLHSITNYSVKLLGYHSGHSYKAKLPLDKLKEIKDSPFVKWVGYSTLRQKLHPNLFDEINVIDDNIVINESAANKQMLVYINLFDNDINSEFKNVLEQKGVNIFEYNKNLLSYRASLTPNILKDIINLDFILFVEGEAKTFPLHDESMSSISADYLRSSYDGSGVSMGIIDSGFEADHQDLPSITTCNDYSSDNDCEEDNCGHGSHVSGTIFGRGNADSKYKGVASGITDITMAKIVQNDCSIFTSDFENAINWIGDVASPPDIVSISIGTNYVSCRGTDQGSRNADSNVYDDGQILVVAAGNCGPGGNNGQCSPITPGASETITSPGCAKNVITIGAVKDYGNRTTELKAMIYKGAVAYWHFDENGDGLKYLDSSGFGNTGTPLGGIVNVSGIIKGAPQFDGVDDRIALPSAKPGWNPNNGTLAFWVKLAYAGSTNPGQNMFFQSQNSSTQATTRFAAGRGVWARSCTTCLFFDFRDGGSNITYNIASWGANTWHHVAMTWNSTNASIYDNGILVAEDEITPLSYFGQTNEFGANQNSMWLNGTLDEFAIYNRTLTPSEVKQLYLRSWYDYSPQLFLLQPFKNNRTWLNSSDGQAPTQYDGSLKNVSGPSAGVTGVNISNGFLNYGAAGNFNEREGTMEFWVKPQWNGNDGLTHYLFDTGTTDDFSILKLTDNTLRAFSNNPNSYWFGSSTDISSWTAGNWHHFALTWNNYTSNRTIYIDGALNNNSGAAFVIPAQTSFVIGSPAAGTPYWCNCAFSEFRISRKALTAQEINLSFSKGRQLYQNEYLLNSSNYAAGDTLKLEYSPKDSTGTSGAAQNSTNLNVHAPKMAEEAEGDTAIELGINSSLPTATKYSEQQVYVRNLSNNQTLGTFDWIASFGSQRWLLNYITTGESYVRAPNLTTAVYVLEIADKTSVQITDEVSRLINSTKS